MPEPPIRSSRWPLARLSELTLKIGSGATPTGGSETYQPTRTRYALVRSQNVYDRHFSDEGLAFITDDQAERLRGAELQLDDVLLNITGDGVTFGRACALPRRLLPACVNQHVSIVRVDPRRADSRYVLSFLTHPNVKRYIESFNAGGSRRAITKAHIEAFELPLAPLGEQRAIGEMLGAIDDKIELNRRTNETLEAMARALFQSWFVDFDPVRAKMDGRQPEGMDAVTTRAFPRALETAIIGVIPQGWAVRPLYECATWINGAAYRDFEFCQPFEGLPIVKIAELKAGVSSQTRFTQSNPGDKYRINTGDVLFSWSGNPDTSIDTFIWAQGAAWLNQHIFRVVTHAPAERTLLIYLLRHLRRRFAEIARDKQTTGLGHVTVGDMQRLQVCWPDAGAREAFERTASPLQRALEARVLESLKLIATRDALLPRLLSGELRVAAAERALGGIL